MDTATQRVEIRHYLIDPNDKKDVTYLPDFIRDREDFVYILLQKTSFVYVDSIVAGRVHKDEVLHDHYTKRAGKSLPGYDHAC